jgi:hypothetical protein
MKTNVTLKLDADLLREARIMAAEQGSSISALLAAQLEKVVRERRDYPQAKRKARAWAVRRFTPLYPSHVAWMRSRNSCSPPRVNPM